MTRKLDKRGALEPIASKLAPTVSRYCVMILFFAWPMIISKPEMPHHPLQLNPQLRQLDTGGGIALHRQR